MDEQQRQLAFGQRLQSYQPAGWNQIPDLGLYMDQVITYMDRQCRDLYTPGERILTPAMVNNYVKLGLVKRPVAKKYSRESLAQLLMICTLKQAVSVEGIKVLLMPEDGQDTESLYRHFCNLQSDIFSNLARELPLASGMTCAVRCAAYRFLCNYVPTASPDVPGKSAQSKRDPGSL